MLVLRRPGLSDALTDTDPQRTGVPPLRVQALSPEAEETAQVVTAFLDQARAVLAEERPANGLLLRGFQRHKFIPSLTDRFGLNGLCLARYPMYRGLCSLLGIDVVEERRDIAGQVEILSARYGQDDHSFFFLHVKGTDKAGEDGEFDEKVRIIQEVDTALGDLMLIQPDVLAVTADHTTPEMMASHSWHPVPVALHSPYVRKEGRGGFNEVDCARGSLGLRPALHLMGLALANARRLKKFGA